MTVVADSFQTLFVVGFNSLMNAEGFSNDRISKTP
jgi:hypothetical protein